MYLFIHVNQHAQLDLRGLISYMFFFPHRQDIKELKEELSEERSKRTALQVSEDTFIFSFLETPCLYTVKNS